MYCFSFVAVTITAYWKVMYIVRPTFNEFWNFIWPWPRVAYDISGLITSTSLWIHSHIKTY